MSTQNLLLGTLVVQLGLAALTWWPHTPASIDAIDLVASGNAITAITVLGKGDAKVPVELASVDGVWEVVSASQFPADPDKVAELVSALADLSLRAPVATHASAHEGLGVTDAGFERKITFTADGTTHTLLVGPAAGRAMHVRLAGEDAVYKVKGISAYGLKDEARSYLPSYILDLDAAALTRLEVRNALGTLTLRRDDAGWQVDGPNPGPAEAEAVSDLLATFAKVRLSEVVGAEVLPEHGLTDAAVRVTWTQGIGEAASEGGMVLGAEVDGKAYLRVDDHPQVVRTPAARLGDLATLEPSMFLAVPAGPVAP